MRGLMTLNMNWERKADMVPLSLAFNERRELMMYQVKDIPTTTNTRA